THPVDSNSIVVEGYAVDESPFLEPAAALIDEQEIALRVVDDEDGRQTVFVVISTRHTHPLASRLTETGLFCDILEFAVSKIVIQPIRNADVARGAAIDFALERIEALVVGVRRPDCVIGDDEVRQTIIVIVKPG